MFCSSRRALPDFPPIVAVLQVGELVVKFDKHYEAEPASFAPGVAGGILEPEEATVVRHSSALACE